MTEVTWDKSFSLWHCVLAALAKNINTKFWGACLNFMWKVPFSPYPGPSTGSYCDSLHSCQKLHFCGFKKKGSPDTERKKRKAYEIQLVVQSV